jgi:hypothetical protein
MSRYLPEPLLDGRLPVSGASRRARTSSHLSAQTARRESPLEIQNSGSEQMIHDRAKIGLRLEDWFLGDLSSHKK